MLFENLVYAVDLGDVSRLQSGTRTRLGSLPLGVNIGVGDEVLASCSAQTATYRVRISEVSDSIVYGANAESFLLYRSPNQ